MWRIIFLGRPKGTEPSNIVLQVPGFGRTRHPLLPSGSFGYL